MKALNNNIFWFCSQQLLINDMGSILFEKRTIVWNLNCELCTHGWHRNVHKTMKTWKCWNLTNWGCFTGLMTNSSPPLTFSNTLANPDVLLHDSMQINIDQ